MSRNVSQAANQERSALYGAFVVLALVPSLFCVAFALGVGVGGVASGRAWLTALYPMVLLVVARFIPSAWRRSRLMGWVLIAGAAAAGVLLWWHMGELLGVLGLTSVMRLVVPAVLVVMYATFAIVVGSQAAQRSGISHDQYTPNT